MRNPPSRQQLATARKIRALVDNASALARRIGVSQPEIQKILSGERHLYGDRVFAIAKALGVSTDYLLDESREGPDPPYSAEEEHLLWLCKKLKISPEDASGLIAEKVVGARAAETRLGPETLEADDPPPEIRGPGRRRSNGDRSR